MHLRLGDILVQRGVLTEQQRGRIAEYQRLSDEPFGVLAERLFGVSESDVEGAWAEQYAGMADRFDPALTPVDPAALRLIDRRQAWQFKVLPVHFNGSEVAVATTPDNLPRALRFIGWRVGRPCYFLIAEPDDLEEALARHYPMAGMPLRADSVGG